MVVVVGPNPACQNAMPTCTLNWYHRTAVEDHDPIFPHRRVTGDRIVISVLFFFAQIRRARPKRRNRRDSAVEAVYLRVERGNGNKPFILLQLRGECRDSIFGDAGRHGQRAIARLSLQTLQHNIDVQPDVIEYFIIYIGLNVGISVLDSRFHSAGMHRTRSGRRKCPKSSR